MESKYIKWGYYLLLILIVAYVFQTFIGFDKVSPYSYKWMYQVGSDMAPDIATWEHYKYSDGAGLPMGTFKSYAFPQLIGVGNTNIVPWLHMPAKLFGKYMGPNFNLFGFFILTCFILQVYFGEKLMQYFKVKHSLLRLAAVICLVIAPPFLFRIVHLALCAHWIVLAGIYVYLISASNIRKSVYYSILGFFAATTHPYLILFPILMSGASFLKSLCIEKSRLVMSMLVLISSVIGALIGFYISGVFTLASGASSAGGLGEYASNLNTFFNNLKVTNASFLNFNNYLYNQYEGYGYLGLGILIVWILVLCHRSFYSWMKHSFKRHWPLFLVCLIALVYATGLVFTYNDYLIAKVPIKEGSKLMSLLSIFRSSGRYIWLPSYVLTIVPLIYLYQHYKTNAWKINILGLVLIIIQMWDVTPLYSRKVKDEYYITHDYMESLIALSQEANAIYTYPTYRRDLVEMDDMQYLVGRIGKQQKNITAGHLPRPNIKAQDSVITHLLSSENSEQWPIEDKDIILTSEKEVAAFRAIYDNKSALCYRLGGYRVLIKSNNEALQKWLLANKWQTATIETVTIDAFLQEQDTAITTIVVAVDEASTGLTDSQRKRLQVWGNALPTLAYRNSYIGIKTGALPTKEYIKTDETNLSLDTMIHKVSLNIISTAGVDHPPLLKINSQAIDSLSRGLNIIKIDEKGKVKAKVCFDTYRSGYVTPDQIIYYP